MNEPHNIVHRRPTSEMGGEEILYLTSNKGYRVCTKKFDAFGNAFFDAQTLTAEETIKFVGEALIYLHERSKPSPVHVPAVSDRDARRIIMALLLQLPNNKSVLTQSYLKHIEPYDLVRGTSDDGSIVLELKERS